MQILSVKSLIFKVRSFALGRKVVISIGNTILYNAASVFTYKKLMDCTDLRSMVRREVSPSLCLHGGGGDQLMQKIFNSVFFL